VCQPHARTRTQNWVDGVPPLGWHDTAIYCVIPALLVIVQLVSAEITKQAINPPPPLSLTLLLSIYYSLSLSLSLSYSLSRALCPALLVIVQLVSAEITIQATLLCRIAKQSLLCPPPGRTLSSTVCWCCYSYRHSWGRGRQGERRLGQTISPTQPEGPFL
jgi:hypothetical protein